MLVSSLLLPVIVPSTSSLGYNECNSSNNITNEVPQTVHLGVRYKRIALPGMQDEQKPENRPN